MLTVSVLLQIHHAEENLGISDENSGFLLTVMALSAAVSTTMVGLLSDQIAFSGKVLVLQGLLLLSGISTALLPFYGTYELLAVYMMTQGVSLGFTALIPVISVEIVGEAHCTIALGLIVLYTTSGVFGPPIAGLFLSTIYPLPVCPCPSLCLAALV